MENEWLNMKIKIRRNVFETNSSSVHSFTFCTDSEFEQWKRGKLIFDGWENKLIPISDMKHDCDEARYYTYNHFFEGYAFEYETFWDNCTTPSGDKVVAFGYYGHD
jgi:hypothetical protein